MGLNSRDFWATDNKLLFKVTDNFKVTSPATSSKDDSAGQGYYNLTPAITQANLTPGSSLRSDSIRISRRALYLRARQIHDRLGKQSRIKGSMKSGVSVTALWNAPSVDVTSITAFRISMRLYIRY